MEEEVREVSEDLSAAPTELLDMMDSPIKEEAKKVNLYKKLLNAKHLLTYPPHFHCKADYKEYLDPVSLGKTGPEYSIPEDRSSNFLEQYKRLHGWAPAPGEYKPKKEGVFRELDAEERKKID